MSHPLEKLSLLTPEQMSRWRGLPLHWVRTPEGKWDHKFTPTASGVALLDTGSLSTRMTIRGRTMELDLQADTFGPVCSGREVLVNQVGASNARRVLLELEGVGSRHPLFDDDLVSTALRSDIYFRDLPLAQAVRAMVREIWDGCPNGTLFAESLSIGVALHVSRTRGASPASPGREGGKLNAQQWARLEELVANDLASDLSLTTLSAAVSMSKPHFVRLFRNTTGTSPHRYVLRKRLEYARELVLSSDATLVDVALQAGFSSQSHLTRMFRQRYEITPSNARRFGVRNNSSG